MTTKGDREDRQQLLNMDMCMAAKSCPQECLSGKFTLWGGDTKSPLKSVIHVQRDRPASFFDHFPQSPHSTGQSFSCNIFLHMVHAQYESLKGLFSRMAAGHIPGINLHYFLSNKNSFQIKCIQHSGPSHIKYLQLKRS